LPRHLSPIFLTAYLCIRIWLPKTAPTCQPNTAPSAVTQDFCVELPSAPALIGQETIWSVVQWPCEPAFVQAPPAPHHGEQTTNGVTLYIPNETAFNYEGNQKRKRERGQKVGKGTRAGKEKETLEAVPANLQPAPILSRSSPTKILASRTGVPLSTFHSQSWCSLCLPPQLSSLPIPSCPEQLPAMFAGPISARRCAAECSQSCTRSTHGWHGPYSRGVAAPRCNAFGRVSLMNRRPVDCGNTYSGNPTKALSSS
jgi:hypothetical protein